MKFFIFRKSFQILIFTLFILGNLRIFNLLSGDLSSSEIFGVNFLFDPLCALQMFLAGATLSADVIIGSLLVLFLYGVLFPKAFCSWVCPVGFVTEISDFFRRKFNIRQVVEISKNTKYYILALICILSFAYGFLAFESVSFVGIFTRAIVFLMPFVFGVAFVIFVFDLFICRICVNLCPLGAFYALIGKKALVRVKYNIEICTACNECLKVCPQDSALSLIKRTSGFVGDECISCGKCVSNCEFDALKFDIRSLRSENEKDL